MKRELKKWLDTMALSPHRDGEMARDALDSDARLRAELRRLKKENLKLLVRFGVVEVRFDPKRGYTFSTALKKPARSKR